jgi:integrase
VYQPERSEAVVDLGLLAGFRLETATHPPDGSLWNPESFGKSFRWFAQRCGIKVRLHDMRHTTATLMLRAGVPLKVVSEFLGHSTTAITADIYSHVLDDMKQDAADRLGTALRNRKAKVS